jgi:hypothetical protein
MNVIVQDPPVEMFFFLTFEVPLSAAQDGPSIQVIPLAVLRTPHHRVIHATKAFSNAAHLRFEPLTENTFLLQTSTALISFFFHSPRPDQLPVTQQCEWVESPF